MGAALFQLAPGKAAPIPVRGRLGHPATRIGVRRTKITNENLIGEEVTIIAITA
jgi:hypothetical protein